MSDIKTPLIWYGSANHFGDWPEDIQQLTKDFLTIHDIDLKDVPSNSEEEWSAIDTPDGPRLRIWLYVRNETGGILICPYCPACTQKRLLNVPLKAIPPPMPGATYTAFAPEALAPLGWPTTTQMEELTP